MDKYSNPLVNRYATKEMSYVWSPEKKFSTWRKLWCALARSQYELGLEQINEEQLIEMEEHINDIDWDMARQKEQEFRHDVMGHIHTFGHVCPLARPIIHLGATSCFVGDNTDIIQIKESLNLLMIKMIKIFDIMSKFSLKYKNLPTLGYTHYQPAQMTTVGKRASLWLQDLLIDFYDIERLFDTLPLRGVKGTTGTQASFLELFDGDHDKVIQLDEKICEKMGFDRSITLTGQTYTRKIDYQVLSVLAGIGHTAHKLSTDIRLLANLKEIEEPFSKSQIGSSAMPYKRNPMRCERCCSIARYLMSLPSCAGQTHSTQWFERTLDDSANRRIILPQAFLSADVLLSLIINIMDGLAVYPKVIERHVMAELPFMASENILMECVKEGGDRQTLHEVIRKHSLLAGKRVKEEGLDNDLIERIKQDDTFQSIHSRLDQILEPSSFIGRSSQQVDEFITNDINPILEKYNQYLSIEDKDEIKL